MPVRPGRVPGAASGPGRVRGVQAGLPAAEPVHHAAGSRSARQPLLFSPAGRRGETTVRLTESADAGAGGNRRRGGGRGRGAGGGGGGLRESPGRPHASTGGGSWLDAPPHRGRGHLPLPPTRPPGGDRLPPLPTFR